MCHKPKMRGQKQKFLCTSGKTSYHQDSEVRSLAVFMTIFQGFSCLRTVKIRSIKTMLLNFWQNPRYGNCQNLQEKRMVNPTGTENRYSAKSFRKGLTWSSKLRFANNATPARVWTAKMMHM